MKSSAEVVYQGRYLEIHKDGRWEFVARRNAAGSVHVVAVTDTSELILVEQFRRPVQARTLELPAGIIGDEAAHHGETVEACAQRELMEETGHAGREVRVLHRGPTAPGLTSERFNIVAISGLSQSGAGGGVDDENITVHRVPLHSVRGWLTERQRSGLQVDHRIYAGLYLLDQ